MSTTSMYCGHRPEETAGATSDSDARWASDLPGEEAEAAQLMRWRVALATSDGTRVDQHFATAMTFHVYDLVGDSWSFVGERDNSGARCGCGSENGCGSDVFATVLALLADVDLVVVSRIGGAATTFLLDRGIRGYLASGPIRQILTQLGRSPRVRFLMERKRNTA